MSEVPSLDGCSSKTGSRIDLDLDVGDAAKKYQRDLDCDAYDVDGLIVAPAGPSLAAPPRSTAPSRTRTVMLAEESAEDSGQILVVVMAGGPHLR